MTGTPALSRLNAVPPGGYIVPSGVATYKSRVREGGPTQFLEWRRAPLTVALLSALQELALNPPPEMSGDSQLTQYGVTQGLSLAATLLSDPTVVWPDLFNAAQNTPENPRAQVNDTFNTSIDDVFDS